MAINNFFSEILIYISDFSRWVQQHLDGIRLPELRHDWLVIFFFIFVIIIVALSLGRTRMLIALVSIYIAAFIELRFVWLDKLKEIEFFKGKPDFWLHLILFFVIYFVVFSILNHSILKHRFSLSETSALSILMIAFFEIGFLVSIILNYFPPELLERVPSRFAPYFATKTALFGWAVLAVLFLLTFPRKKKSSDSYSRINHPRT